MNKRLLTWTSYIYIVSYAFTVTSIGPCNAPIARTFHAGERIMGLLIAAHFFGFILSTFWAGALIGRVGLKPVMVGGVALLGVALLAFGAAPSLQLLFAAMILMGMGGGAQEAAANALVGHMYSDTRVYSLNLLHIFFGVGAFSWPMAAGAMLNGGMTWRSLYFIIGAFSLVNAVAMGVQRFPVVQKDSSGDRGAMFTMLRQPTVLLLAGVIALYVGAEIGINSWIVRYFDEELLKGNPLILHLGVSHKQIATSFFLTLYWFSMTVGRVFTTLAGRVVPGVTLLRFVTFMSAVCAIATFAVGNILPAAIFLGLTGLFFSGIFPTTLAIGGNRYPESLGLVSGILIGFSGIGNVVLNSAIGEIAQRTGSIRAGLMFVAALLLVMVACAFGIKKMKYPAGHN